MKVLYRSCRLAAVLLFLALPATSWASPIDYFFQSGSMTVRATAGATELAVATIDMNGVFVTFDPMAMTLDDFQFTTAQSDPIMLSQPYAGITEIVLEHATIQPGTGYMTLFASESLGNFSVTAGPVDIFGEVTTTSTMGDVDTSPFSLTSDALAVTIDQFDKKRQMELTGITLGILEIPNEVPLVLKGDVVFNGLVPEPSAATLLFAGMLVIGHSIRRRQQL